MRHYRGRRFAGGLAENIDVRTASTRRGRSAFEDLAALLTGFDPVPCDWNGVLQEANRQLVAPALYVVFRDRGSIETIPGEVNDYLRLLHDLNEERNRRLKRQALETIDALNEAGIEPLLIKGTALLMILPEHRLGSRMISDLDLVVDGNAVDAGSARLAEIGYEALPDDPGPHAYGKFCRPADAGSLDLHLRPPGPASLFLQEATHRSTKLEVMGSRMRIPTLAEWVSHLIVHDMLQDHGLRTGDIGLRHLLDCREMLSLGYDIRWDSVRHRLASGWPALARDVFFLNLQRIVGLEVGGSVGLLPRLLYHREIALQRNTAYRKLDGVGLSVLRGSWRSWKRTTARGQWTRMQFLRT